MMARPALVVLLSFSRAARAADGHLTLNAQGQGTYVVEARFWTASDLPGVWGVLTDYTRLPTFIPSLKESELQHKTTDFLVLKQEAVGRALGVFNRHLHVRLHITEKENREITFKDTARRDFVSYYGSWQIDPALEGGTWVTYHLIAQPAFYAPSFIARKSFRTNAKELLMSVEAEIARREHLKSKLLCCSKD